MEFASLKPLSGHVLVKVESLFGATEGIIIPETAEVARSIVGTVVDVNPREEDIMALGARILPGQRVVVSHYMARSVEDDYWIYPLSWTREDGVAESGIVAILDPTLDVSSFEHEIPRCQWCGPAREGTKQSTLLMDGICPRCHKDDRGIYHDPDDTPPPTAEDNRRMAVDIEGQRTAMRRHWAGGRK